MPLKVTQLKKMKSKLPRDIYLVFNIYYTLDPVMVLICIIDGFQKLKKEIKKREKNKNKTPTWLNAVTYFERISLNNESIWRCEVVKEKCHA